MRTFSSGTVLTLALSLFIEQSDAFAQGERDTTVTPLAPITVEQANERRVFTVVEQMPHFPGGEDQMYRFLATNIRYPSDAYEQGASGAVYVTFVVEKDGSLSDVRVLRDVHPSLDAEAVRVVSSMPAWEPGKHQGEVCCVQFNLPIRFTMRTEVAEVPKPVVEEQPAFPGGVTEMYKYIAKNLRYPEGKEIEKIEGTAYLTFEVDTAGALRDIRVLRGIHPAFDAEAVRLVEGMPAWTPGRRDGKAVRTQFNLPVKFRGRR